MFSLVLCSIHGEKIGYVHGNILPFYCREAFEFISAYKHQTELVSEPQCSTLSISTLRWPELICAMAIHSLIICALRTWCGNSATLAELGCMPFTWAHITVLAGLQQFGDCLEEVCNTPCSVHIRRAVGDFVTLLLARSSNLWHYRRCLLFLSCWALFDFCCSRVPLLRFQRDDFKEQ